MKTLIFLFLSAAALCADDKAHAPESKPATQQAITITVTVGDLIAMQTSGALQKLASQDFPAVVAYRINRLMAALRPEIAQALQAQAKLFTEENSEAVKGSDGARTIKPDHLAAYLEQMKPLLAEKVKLAVAPLNFQTDLAGAKLSASDIE